MESLTKNCFCVGPHSTLDIMTSQSALSKLSESLGKLVASTEMNGAWLPLKKAVSISQPIKEAEETPNWMITQSHSAVLCLRVSQPSYHAPAYVNREASLIGYFGLIKFSAAANHSSENANTFPPNFSPMMSVYFCTTVSLNSSSLTFEILALIIILRMKKGNYNL